MSITPPVITTWARFLYHAPFFPEELRRRVTGRDPEQAAREAAPEVFAFEFYDVVTATATLGDLAVQLSSANVNISGRYYIDAEELTADGVAALPGDHSSVLSNMRANGLTAVLRCRAGHFEFRKPGDSLVSSGRAATS